MAWSLVKADPSFEYEVHDLTEKPGKTHVSALYHGVVQAWYPSDSPTQRATCTGLFLRALAALKIVQTLYYCGETDDWSLALRDDPAPNHGELLPLLVSSLVSYGRENAPKED